MNIPQLPDEAKGELMAGDEKVSKSRGNLNWWVLMVLLSMLLAVSIAYNATLQGQIKDLKSDNTKLNRKVDTLQLVINSMLRQQIEDLKPVKQRAIITENKTDSLYQRLKQ